MMIDNNNNNNNICIYIIHFSLYVISTNTITIHNNIMYINIHTYILYIEVAVPFSSYFMPRLR